ncbi:carboxypeptidase-like regulatory domain-containing protein [Micromonospora matsumotoense]|uniref:carboxypeptidase-like regulatory domain-containing protein n=1 Tax=Micromonospora matsumotoense TaxID=121616 RepID=UPI003F53F670
MSTHRRAWTQRAGVVVALVAGALLTVPATPAFAAPSVNNVSASPSSVEAGKTTRVSYSLTVGDDSPVDVSVTSSNGKLRCVDGCSRNKVDQGGGSSASFALADDASNGSATITVKAVDANGAENSASTTVTLVAKAAPQTTPPQDKPTVKSVSGKVVVAATGDAVPNAVVGLEDSTGKQFNTTSDGSGNFRITGSSANPIAPGSMVLGASKDGIVATKPISAGAGQSLSNQRISLALKVEVTPSVTPSTSVEPTPTDETTEETTEESAEPTDGQQQAASQDDDSGFGSFLIILLGGLLVAAGVGTIVLLWIRRKNADDGDGPAGAAAAGGVPGPRGPRGTDDQTRVVNRVGAGPDPTMVGSSALSDAPTMMHRPVVDDVPPDPYAAPPQPYGAPQDNWAGAGGYGEEPAGQAGYGQPGGYGAAPSSGGGYGAAGAGAAGAAGAYGAAAPPAGGYGNAPASGGGYGNAPASGGGYGNAPASGGGYGDAPASGGGYGGRDYGATAGAGYPAQEQQGGGYGGERYDEPTGRYTGDSTSYAPAADPYPTSTYQPEQDAYGQSGAAGYGQPEPGGYGRGAEPTGGYAGGGYGQQAGYDAGAAQGYGGQHGGYDQQTGAHQSGGAHQGGYDQPTGGHQAGSAHQGGYDQRAGGQHGGYDQRGGAHQGGYEQQPGYDQQGAAYDQQPGYGSPQGGYGQAGGYGGEQSPGGYGQEPPQQRTGGYDQQGYDQQQGGYYGDQQQPGRDQPPAGRARPDGPPPERGGRRLDWLDD